LQFAKAGSTATLSQQEKNNSAGEQRGGSIRRGDVSKESSSRWPIASRRARRRRSMLEPQLHRLRLRHKTSAWAYSGSTVGKQNHCLGRKPP
jgi:hypothetical protein